MAALKGDSLCNDAVKDESRAAVLAPLIRLAREYEELATMFEMGLVRSLEDTGGSSKASVPVVGRADIRRQACRLAVAEMTAKNTRRQIRKALSEAERRGRHAEERLHWAIETGRAMVDQLDADDDSSSVGDASDSHDELCDISSGYFCLYSTELFDLLGEPTNIRFGTLRFRRHSLAAVPVPAHVQVPAWVSVDLALNGSFYVADSLETLPHHTFTMPKTPSLRNRGILSRRPIDGGAYPDYDSWLLFTFLGEGCLKLEVPIEMCAHIYGGPLLGRENEEITFWGVFVHDDCF